MASGHPPSGCARCRPSSRRNRECRSPRLVSPCMRERAVQTDQAERHARPAPVRAPARPAAFLALAAAIGNRAAAQVARAEAGAGGAGPAPAAREDQGADGGPGVPSFDAAGATDEQRIAEIRTRLGTGDRVTEIWTAFADIPATANAHADLWRESVKRDRDLAEDEQVEAAFKERVEALARRQLAAGRDTLWTEIEELGVDDEHQGKRDPEHLDAVVRLQKQADDVQKALRVKSGLLQIPVGWIDPEPSADPAEASTRGARMVLFEPCKPPQRGGGEGETGFRRYDEVFAHYEQVEAVLAQGMSHPALFGLAQEGRGPGAKDAPKALEGFSTDAPGVAQANIMGTLHDLYRKVEKAEGEIGGAIDFRDLRPLHDAIAREAPFSQAYEASVAAEAVRDHDDMKTLIAVGLSLLQGIALLAAPATGGAGAAVAALIGSAAGAAQAGFSYADFQALKTAREARTAPDRGLVTAEQFDDAKVALILDTVFAFVDGIEGVSAILRPGAKAAGDVAELGRLAADQREQVLGEAMATLGPGPAIEQAGGIDAVRQAAGDTNAGKRAEGFVGGLEDALGERLAARAEEDAAAPLLPEAQRFVAGRAEVAEPRALPSLLPQYTQEERLQAFVEKVKGRGVEGWAEMTPMKRASVACERAAGMLPLPPGYRLDNGLAKGTASFDVKKWEIVLSLKDFESAEMSASGLAKLGELAVHESEHGSQFLEAAAYHIKTSPNPDAAVAELKFTYDWDPDAVDLAAGSAPLDPAREARAKAYHDEFLGGKQGFYNQVEGAITGASDRLKAARADWQSRKKVVEAMWKERAMGDPFTQACEAMTTAFREAAYEENSIRAYLNLNVEKGAFARQEVFRLQEELRFAREAREEMASYMDKLVALGVLAGGVVIGAGVTGYVVVRQRAPAHQ